MFNGIRHGIMDISSVYLVDYSANFSDAVKENLRMRKMVEGFISYKFAIVYLITGSAWILFFDEKRLVEHWNLTTLYKMNEWFYLILSSAVLCLWIYRHQKKIQRSKGSLQLTNLPNRILTFDHSKMEDNLRKALDRKQFKVYYQPQVDASNGSVLGAEALLRWYHPDGGIVSPNTFIPLAEQTGLIVHIGDWVLREACMQAKKWADQGLPPMKVSVNISARQFEQSDIVDRVQLIIEEIGIDPSWLTLELTESVMMSGTGESIARMLALKQLGINIALDDFGTGYSSLSYLKKFPIDILKMDKSFVSDITIHEKDAAIATAIITLAHHLDMQVVAEGVETEEQFTRLTQLGSDHVQGYLFSAPQPAELFLQWLQTHFDKTGRKEDPKWLSAN